MSRNLQCFHRRTAVVRDHLLTVDPSRDCLSAAKTGPSPSFLRADAVVDRSPVLPAIPALPATYDLNSVDLGSMPANRAHFVDHREGHGEALFAKVSELDFEGIVAK